MLADISASTFHEWQLYDRIEPFGEFRSELRHGQSMALTANLNRDPKNKPEPFNAMDFMNFIEKPVEELTLEETLTKIDRDVFGV